MEELQLAEVTNIDRKAFLTQKFTKWKNEADKNIKKKKALKQYLQGDNLKKYIPSIEERNIKTNLLYQEMNFTILEQMNLKKK